MSKPTIIAQMKKGQSWGAVENLCDTFNWMAKWLSNVKGGNGIRIEKGDTNYPVIKANIEAGEGIEVDDSGDSVKISASGSSSECKGFYEFQSAEDSNISISVTGEGTEDDPKKVTIGVYYL